MDFWTSAASKARAWRSLTGRERYLFVLAVLLLPMVRAGLWLLGLGPLQRILDRLSRVSRRSGIGRAEEVETRARAVSSAARHVRASCLERSLLLWYLLRRQGVAAELRIGVRKAGSALQAHAWIEVDAQVLGDMADDGMHFTPFEQAIAPATAEPR